MTRRNMTVARQAPAPAVRCAIYTRKSSSEGLDMDFNSLDAQRESCEAYIKSQAHEGWAALPDRYDDGGFTGGNVDRPAFQRLMADIKEGKIDSVVVYKVDRLSRSLLDFARIMEVFEKHNVSFVSVTQQFNTATSMGRLMLNVLLSFAQFEREIISERTRDKIAAARKKGKWAGGAPVLGYDIDATSRRLVVNEAEAAQVREIFDLYLQTQSITAAVERLNERGWTTKCWTTKKEKLTGGKPFDKPRLYRLLTNVAYIGKVPHKGAIYEGEHEAILDAEMWEKTRRLLKTNKATGGKHVRNKHGALLRGLVRCASCGCAMTHATTGRNGRTYRYYVCQNAQKRGWKACPTKSVPAADLEDFVVERIREIGKDPALVEATVEKIVERQRREKPVLVAERSRLQKDVARLNAEARRLVEALAQGNGGAGSIVSERIADVERQIEEKSRKLTEIGERLILLELETVDGADVRRALGAFDPIWDVLYVKEKTRIVQLLVREVGYNGVEGAVSITFHPSGIKRFAAEMQ